MNSWLEGFFVTGGDSKSRVVAGEIRVSIRASDHLWGEEQDTMFASAVRDWTLDKLTLREQNQEKEHRLLVMKVELNLC